MPASPASVDRIGRRSGPLGRALVASLIAGLATVTRAEPLPSPTPEQSLSAVVQALRAGQRQEAMSQLQALTLREPTFRIAQLLYGDLLAARAGREVAIPLRDADDTALQELAEEVQLRLAAEVQAPAADQVPNAIIALSPEHPHVVAVDLERARLFLLRQRDGVLEIARHHYAAIGRNGSGKEIEGDLRTPIGIYRITAWMEDRALPELYGAGALPVSYPNAWDRLHRRTGHGIWLHGVPRDTYTRAPRSSEGCVTMANDDLMRLQPDVRIGETPVIFSNELSWRTPVAAALEQREWLDRLEGWRARWAAVDTEGYLGYYHSEFTAPGMNRTAFARHKRWVNAGKTFIEIDIDPPDIFRYPGADAPTVMARFRMHYRSNNFESSSIKLQFWRQDADGQWKIFREENADS
mgnify:CR=1 FL=1